MRRRRWRYRVASVPQVLATSSGSASIRAGTGVRRNLHGCRANVMRPTPGSVPLCNLEECRRSPEWVQKISKAFNGRRPCRRKNPRTVRFLDRGPRSDTRKRSHDREIVSGWRSRKESHGRGISFSAVKFSQKLQPGKGLPVRGLRWRDRQDSGTGAKSLQS